MTLLNVDDGNITSVDILAAAERGLGGEVGLDGTRGSASGRFHKVIGTPSCTLYSSA